MPRIVRAVGGAAARRGRSATSSSRASPSTATSAAPITEATPVAELEDPDTEEILENYGALKAACERVVEEVYGDRSARVRAGLIVGPYDPTDRFTYWPRRIAAGGEVLGPGDPDAPVQFVDARDLAAWLVRLALDGPGGVFNATGPARAAHVRASCSSARARRSARTRDVVWVDEQRVLDAGVAAVDGAAALAARRPTTRAWPARTSAVRVDAGPAFRPLEETVRRHARLGPHASTRRPPDARTRGEGSARSCAAAHVAPHLRVKREPQRGALRPRDDRRDPRRGAPLPPRLRGRRAAVRDPDAARARRRPALRARLGRRAGCCGTPPPACRCASTVTLFDGLVLARSVFNHSVNYRSVVVFGTATLVGGDEKREALRALTEQLAPGRWDEARQPTEQELKATWILSLPLDEASAKVRSGPPRRTSRRISTCRCGRASCRCTSPPSRASTSGAACTTAASALRDDGRLPFVHRETVRFRDLDGMGHVNNAVFSTYLEQARLAVVRRDRRARAGRRDPRAHGDRLPLAGAERARSSRSASGPSRLGTKSFELEYELRAGGRLVAEAKSVLVGYDYGRTRAARSRNAGKGD